MTVNPELARLYDEIRKSCNEEWEKISKIFPNASYVMKMFIQRIFVQSVNIFYLTVIYIYIFIYYYIYIYILLYI